VVPRSPSSSPSRAALLSSSLGHSPDERVDRLSAAQKRAEGEMEMKLGFGQNRHLVVSSDRTVGQ
jgi:hypothetical protein